MIGRQLAAINTARAFSFAFLLLNLVCKSSILCQIGVEHDGFRVDIDIDIDAVNGDIELGLS